MDPRQLLVISLCNVRSVGSIMKVMIVDEQTKNVPRYYW